MNTFPTVVALAMETAINQLLQLDPETRDQMRCLQGKVIAIELRGLDVTLTMMPGIDKLNVYGHFEGESDTVIRGTPIALARMGMANNAADLLFDGDVEISGDVELGQKFSEIIDGLDIDWEEHLSHFTGDIIAHKLGSFTRGAAKWGRKTMDTVVLDTAEYLQEESEDLPNRSEVDVFLSGVDRLRSDVDRLDARVQRLDNPQTSQQQQKSMKD